MEKENAGRLDCYDTLNAKPLWSAKNTTGKEWLGAFTDGERVFVIAGVNRVFFDKRCEGIFVFSRDGELIGERRPPPELYSQIAMESLSSDVTYLGTRYLNGMPASWYNHSGRWMGWPSDAGKELFAFRIDQRSFANGLEGIVSYADSRHAWTGTSHCIDEILEYAKYYEPPSGFYSVAVDNKHVIYATNTGKVECLRRSDGASQWIYSFPLL